MKNTITYYTGIGSRETPPHILEEMTLTAQWLERKFTNITLRSGGAGGADLAFEVGTNNKEIYLPWYKFNGNTSKLYTPSHEAFELASKIHPTWNRLTQGAKKLHARNMHQVLGANLNTPSDFLLCYTKGGLGSGGTGQAIRLARVSNIPVFDFGRYKERTERSAKLVEFIEKVLK